MKLLFVSDLHIKLRKNQEWESNRVEALFDFLSGVEYDMLVIGGDIFHFSTPTLEEINIFYSNITKLKNVYIIAGNHETLKREVNTFSYLPEIGFKYIGFDSIKTKKTDIYFCSHSHLHKLDNIKQVLRNKNNLLITHIRCDLPPYVKEEYPLYRLSKEFNLVISGDIHHPISPYDNVHYPGQPYSTSFKKEVDHTFFIVDTDTLEIETFDFNLPNEVKVELQPSDIKMYEFNDKDLYVVKVSGTIEEINSLPPLPINAKYEKHVQVEEDDEGEDTVIIVDNKIDILDTILLKTKDMYKLSEDIIEVGRTILARYIK